MRYINNLTLSVPLGWDNEATRATNDVINNAISPSDRGQVWRNLKDKLSDVSHKKCWYCEIIQERSDNAVDHFRPKSMYPWLAFDKRNLHFACTYCNSKRRNPDTGETEGKGNLFPLLDESRRATNPGEETREVPLLLNPTEPNDPGLLDFYVDDGRPCPRYKEEDYEIRFRRADVSIKLYHLDHPVLIEKRKNLSLNISDKIEAANALFGTVDQGNPDTDRAFNTIVRELADAMSEKSELSAFARKVIAGKREYDWVEALLEKI